MKKYLIIILCVWLTCGLLNAQVTWKCDGKKMIILKADPDYGSATDWESVFYDTSKSFAIGPKGEIFVSNNKQHNIFKFSPTGKLIGKFGQKGQGPGDLYHPAGLSILDDKYLVVAEYALRRRISIFDLDGKFVKILKTNHNPFNPIALKNNKIVYYSNKEMNAKQLTIRIFTKDISTGKEKMITSREIPVTDMVRLSDGSLFMFESQIAGMVYNRTQAGNLMVGISNSPDIKIYSPEGKELQTFSLNMKPMPVTTAYIKKFKEGMVASAKAHRATKNTINAIKKTRFENYFARHLPLYKDFITDSNGNLLVFRWRNCFDCQKIVQVYSPMGAFICEYRLDEGAFTFNLDSSFRDIHFSKHSAFGLLQLKGSEDVSIRVVKFTLSRQ